MAKTSIVEREKRRERTVQRYRQKREALKEELRKAYIAEAAGEESDVMALQLKLQAMPRNASKSRLRNRCRITGRPHGVYRKFGLGRNKLREYAMKGAIPGLKKASW